MEETDDTLARIGKDQFADTPAIGFVARAANTSDLIRSLVRAKVHGHECLVVFDSNTPAEVIRLVMEVGATIVQSEGSTSDTESLRRQLVSAAREYNEAGIILAPEDCERIDYERSVASLESSERFGVQAVTQSPVTQRQRLATLAVIPAYNESETIHDVVIEVSEYVDKVIVIDDGSRDDTAGIARDAGAEVIEHETNEGYGAAMQTAFSVAVDHGAETLVILDADGQHDASDIPKLVDRLETSDAEIVIGSRFVDGSISDLPIYRLVGLKAINAFTNLSMGVIRSRSWVSDTQSGFRAYGSKAIESLARDENLSNSMGASTDILHHAHEHNYPLAEVGTSISYEVANASSHNPVIHGLTLISSILRTVERKRPVAVFGVPGFFLTLLGIALGYWSIANYVSTQTFPGGVALGAAVTILAGLLSCFTAIILHSLTVHFDTELHRS